MVLSKTKNKQHKHRMKSSCVTKLCQNGMNFLNDGGRDVGNTICTLMIGQLRRLLQSVTVKASNFTKET